MEQHRITNLEKAATALGLLALAATAGALIHHPEPLGATGTLLVAAALLIRAVSRRRSSAADLTAQFIAQFRHTIREASHNLILTDTEGRIYVLSRGAERLLGYGSGEVEGKPITALVHDPEEVVERARQLSHELGHPVEPGFEALVAKARDGATAEQEWTYRLRDQSRIPVLLSVTAIRAPSGQIVAYLGVAINIAQWKQAEAAVRASEAGLMRAQRLAHIGSFESDQSAHTWRYWSPELYRIMGRDPAQPLPSVDEFRNTIVHPADRERVTEEGILARTERRPFDLEYRIVQPTGEIRHVHGLGYPEYGESGTLIRMTGTVQDITDRKALEQEIEQSRGFLQTVLDHLPVAVFVKDGHPGRFGRFQLWNRASERLFGLSSQEVLGQTDRDLFPKERADFFEMMDRATFAKRSLEDIPEETVPSRTLGTRILHTVKVPIFDPQGEPQALLGFAEDITDRKHAEAALQRYTNELETAKEELERTAAELARSLQDLAVAKVNAEAATRAKSEFLATMSHEIRTPMNAVIGMTGLLLDTELTDEQQEFAQTIKNSGNALLGIINDILDFSKIEAGKLSIEAVPFDLRTAIEEVADLLASRAQEKQLELIIRYRPDTPRRFVGDPGRVRQVMMNLVGNAIKFTPSGYVLVEVEAHPAPNDRFFVQLAVTDTGVGVPADKQAQLFQKFTQADASTTRHFGGTGLGLAITKQLVELMGGSVGMTSVEGHGSTFWIRLPLAADPGGEAAPNLATLAGVPVLAVDDSPTSAGAFAEQLAGWGMQASVAYSGEDALHQVRAASHAGHPFRIVVIDSELPDMTGEALGRALAAEVDLPPANLVMMAAVGRPGDGRRFELAGFHAYLVKPCSADSLRHVLFQLSRPASAKSLITRHTALDEEQHLAPLPEPAPAASGPVLRVLIAEDNVVNQKVTARLLERLGYRVDIAADGNEALEMWSRLPYDIVLMDCQMPNVDGFEATAEIRRREAGNRHTPIIALTANALQGDRERCLEAGMDDYLSKPVNAASLRRILASWASRSL